MLCCAAAAATQRSLASGGSCRRSAPGARHSTPAAHGPPPAHRRRARTQCTHVMYLRPAGAAAKCFMRRQVQRQRATMPPAFGNTGGGVSAATAVQATRKRGQHSMGAAVRTGRHAHAAQSVQACVRACLPGSGKAAFSFENSSSHSGMQLSPAGWDTRNHQSSQECIRTSTREHAQAPSMQHARAMQPGATHP